ncbi:hypothetical protein FHS31_000410 [Sphingomonas vulcanisoli]|uniref:Carbamoyl phosphate synthase preATP-grasp domain-containing protein n=1 Tax=Sphingomonas vulcanisoli TaxID=1658060 RepID=A0ABX0TNZ3_9SPHN|nr:hypothetical protein [Sphingomonas vulcanisoli]NIJ06828.1 hypothetical protein [Sphingomonas vulcanisoli]
MAKKYRKLSNDNRDPKAFYHSGYRLMPKQCTDISSILIIGAGPIVIGHACEFEHSGTQARKALREEGYLILGSGL